MPTREVPIGFDRCVQCGELHGHGFVYDPETGRIDPWTLTCLCYGIVCECRKSVIHRPVSNYWSDEHGPLHVPWFGYLIPCKICSADV